MRFDYEGVVPSPDNTGFSEEVELEYGGDKEALLRTTAHALPGSKTASNLWIRIFGKWYRILPEDLNEGQPEVFSLAFPLGKLADHEILPNSGDNLNLETAIHSLNQRVQTSIELVKRLEEDFELEED